MNCNGFRIAQSTRNFANEQAATHFDMSDTRRNGQWNERIRLLKTAPAIEGRYTIWAFSCSQQNPYFMKKRILGTLFGFLALFGFGAIYYGILTADAAAEMMAQYEGCLHAPKMSLIVLGNILASYLLVYVFDEMGVNDAKSGAYQGAMIMAIVFGIFQAFATAQYTFYDGSFAIIEWVIGIIHGILGGAAIGAYNSKLA